MWNTAKENFNYLKYRDQARKYILSVRQPFPDMSECFRWLSDVGETPECFRPLSDAWETT
jgi:hypothetical protein